VLLNNLADELRRLRPDKRDVSRERSIEQVIDESSSRIDPCLGAEQSSPSDHAMREEESLRLAAGLAKLPDDQRRVIDSHHFRGLSLAEVAVELDRSKAAVAGLLHRGLAKLRDNLSDEA
jgi:RNA polymerase sigma-70 factor (ECF subfamily)